jgi:hypothetical protein
MGHRGAQPTPGGRQSLVARTVVDGMALAHAADTVGVSRQTARCGCANRSRRPSRVAGTAAHGCSRSRPPSPLAPTRRESGGPLPDRFGPTPPSIGRSARPKPPAQRRRLRLPLLSRSDALPGSVGRYKRAGPRPTERTLTPYRVANNVSVLLIALSTLGVIQLRGCWHKLDYLGSGQGIDFTGARLLEAK